MTRVLEWLRRKLFGSPSQDWAQAAEEGAVLMVAALRECPKSPEWEDGGYYHCLHFGEQYRAGGRKPCCFCGKAFR